MPMYATDDNGNIYELNPDTGEGFYRHADQCDFIDSTTPDGTYDRFNDEYQRAVLNERAAIAHQEAVLKMQAAERAEMGRRKRLQNESLEALMENPQYHQNMVRQAVMQGCCCDNKSAKDRWNEMDYDQQVINHHMSGMGQSVARPMNQAEIRQIREAQKMNAWLSGQAAEVQQQARSERAVMGIMPKVLKRRGY